MPKTLAGLVVMVGVLLAACSANTPATTQPATQKAIEVQVTLQEFQIQSSLKDFKANTPYHFVVTNKGTVNHDFAISPPVMQGMAMSAEDMHKQSLAVIDANDLPPGATKTIDVTFAQPPASGSLELACHTAGHHEAGMFMPISVSQ